MASDVETASSSAHPARRPSRLAFFACLAGFGAAMAAAVALWANLGAEVFLTQAFAALAACF